MHQLDLNELEEKVLREDSLQTRQRIGQVIARPGVVD